MDRPSNGASLVNCWFGQFSYETNEARFLILEHILGHPTNLPSATELAELLPAYTMDEITAELHALIERNHLAAYTPSPENTNKNSPSTFYGLTETGIEALKEHGFLKITGVAHKLYNGLNKSELVEQYEELPRPELEPQVEEHLTEHRPTPTPSPVT